MYELAEQDNKKAVQRKAPVVTFIDGKKAIIEFSVTFHIEEDDASLVVVTCGNADRARESLDAKVVSSVINELEIRTLREARQSRSDIENKLIQTLGPRFKKFGLTLDNFSLLEFREIQQEESNIRIQ